MSSNKYRRCMICNRYIDPATGWCPTAEACDQLRSPHKRRARLEHAAARRARAAEVDSKRIGLAAPEVAAAAARVDPRVAVRAAEASRRSRIGWATRRS